MTARLKLSSLLSLRRRLGRWGRYLLRLDPLIGLGLRLAGLAMVAAWLATKNGAYLDAAWLVVLLRWL